MAKSRKKAGGPRRGKPRIRKMGKGAKIKKSK